MKLGYAGDRYRYLSLFLCLPFASPFRFQRKDAKRLCSPFAAERFEGSASLVRGDGFVTVTSVSQA
jgi:hypothetical protein